MDGDTKLGGPRDRFPPTHYSAVVAAGSAEDSIRERALETLIATYWKPAYKYIRVHWKTSNEDAKDLTQGAFARALEKGWFERYDRTKGTFRNYLRVCIDGFVVNERKAAGRLKRGAGLQLVPFDFETAEGELRHHDAAAEGGPEAYFEREWARALFGLAIETLRERLLAAGKETHFSLFERFDLDGGEGPDRPSYESLAAEHGLPITQVTNYLAAARREFRSIVLDRLRAVTGNEAEFRAETRRLLGVDPPPDRQ